MRASDYLPEGPADGEKVLVRLTAVDCQAVELIRQYLVTLPWHPYIGCRTNCIRYALRRTVATLAVEAQRRAKRKQHGDRARGKQTNNTRGKHGKGN